MFIAGENSRSLQSTRLRRHRNQPGSATDPRARTHLLVQPDRRTRKKFTISGLLGSTLSNTGDNATSLLAKKTGKKKTFVSMALSGLGCIKCSSVATGEWEENKVRRRKKKQRRRVENGMSRTTPLTGETWPRVVVVVPDVCCAPGIGLAASDAALIDFVEPIRSVPPRRINGDGTNHRQRSRTARRSTNNDQISASALNPGSHISNARRYGDFRHSSSGGQSRSEMMALQSSLLSGGNLERSDRYGDWRLDVDNMSYEELLELSERIGYVGTGLREDEIFPLLDSLPLLSSAGEDWKCSICQEEYEADDEVGRLGCGHCYHIHCLRQWLLRKNACAVCKAAATAAYN